MRALAKKILSLRSKFYRIPYCVPAWGWAEHWAILRCLLTGRLINGPDKEYLYEAFRQKTGTPYVFGFGSGREAILAALKAWEVGPGDQVILPSYCCESVAAPVLDCGAEPVFCDIGDDLNLDVDDTLSLVNEKTRAIIVPHLFGHPAAIDRVEEGLQGLGCRDRVLVIDDAAQSFGATLHGRLLGTFGDVGIVSFGPGKTMTATGGGLLLTHSLLLASKVEHLSISTLPFVQKVRKLFYWVIFRRWRKYSLPWYPLFRKLLAGGSPSSSDLSSLANMDAAIARCQLRRLDGFLHVRRDRGAILNELISSLPGRTFVSVAPLIRTDQAENVFSKFICFLPLSSEGGQTALIFDHIWLHLGVEIQALYEPIHLKSVRWQTKRSLAKTISTWRYVVQIPVEPSIPDIKWNQITAQIKANFLTTAKDHHNWTSVPV